jgi:flagellar FliJ protein
VEQAPFRFRLERLRELRAGVEDEARERFAGALSQLDAGEALASAAAERVGAAAVAQRSAVGQPQSGAHLQVLQVWRERTELSRQDAAAEVAARAQLVEQRRAEMLAAARDREVLERLKRRRGAEHALTTGRAAAAALDDLSQARHGRKPL